MPEITTFLTYNNQAEEAAVHYLSVFEQGKIKSTMRAGAGGPGPKGSVFSVTFELFGQTFIAVNGAPSFTFTQATSSFSPYTPQPRSHPSFSTLPDHATQHTQPDV